MTTLAFCNCLALVVVYAAMRTKRQRDNADAGSVAKRFRGKGGNREAGRGDRVSKEENQAATAEESDSDEEDDPFKKDAN